MIKVTGLEKMKNYLGQLQAAIEDLNRPVTVPAYDANDLASVNFAIAQVEIQIDERGERYARNATVDNLISQLKAGYREKILMAAMAKRNTSETKNMIGEDQVGEDLRRLENAVFDMQLIDQQSAASHFDLLCHILKSESFREISESLSGQVNLHEWMESGRATERSLAGSATLKWPVDTEKRLGLVIGLIVGFASEEISLFQFAYTFYYSASNVNTSYRKFVAQVLSPFVRDFRSYVVKKIGVNMDDKEKGGQGTVNQSFNFHNSNIASLQTGSHSVANVNMQNNIAGTTELINALNAVAAALAKNSSMPADEKHEILEMVEDSKREAAKESPNKSKIRTYLAGIAGAIGTISDLKSGYDLLVLGAAAAGYTLPTL